MLRDKHQKDADELRRAGKLPAAKRVARKSAAYARLLEEQTKEYLSRLKYEFALSTRDHFAPQGLKLSEAVDIAGARGMQREAQRWDREAKRVKSSTS